MENPTIDWVKQSGRLDGFTPVALRSSKFKLESGINGAPYGLPPFIPFRP
jgi:hypothetical protein